METLSSTLNDDSLLAELRTYDIGDAGIDVDQHDSLSNLAAKSLATGTAELLTPPSDTGSGEIGSALAIPVYRAGRIASIVVMSIKPKTVGAGVFEIWEPVDPYEEVKLRSGYFAHLERFANVSSFVRFERGNGLPGQVWESKQAVIHDDLPSHVGFLRAAGASAGLLQTAVGLPIISGDKLKSVAVVISSEATPIAKGYEVWNAVDDGFTLEGAAYQGLDPAFQLSRDAKLETDTGLPGLAAVHAGATTTENDAILLAGRNQQNLSSDMGSAGPTAGLAIPAYRDNKLTSVMTFLF
ncbi:hypothetical protein LF1_30810 [Rubripirellula obstinata]|uniref:GAF domain-containing protein n=1 Tax=Rubripirellula obstinata TaxID=406547 RepID=A0A5B1CJT4_9BACT|nr:GAF domain-containing protein [Rubripirellula obstinata]KAA1260541.1 hypothetical protein LF1_30810 [Rubripirellula obstinata]